MANGRVITMEIHGSGMREEWAMERVIMEEETVAIKARRLAISLSTQLWQLSTATVSLETMMTETVKTTNASTSSWQSDSVIVLLDELIEYFSFVVCCFRLLCNGPIKLSRFNASEFSAVIEEFDLGSMQCSRILFALQSRRITGRRLV